MLGTTIFLAGSEIEKLALALLQNGVKWVLFSYFYILRFKRTGMIERLQREYPHVQWLLDSGAFTYAVQKTRPGGPGIFLPEPEHYVRGYFDYIERFGENWVRIAEPDLDGIPGMPISVQQVTEWREEMLTRWPHLPIMPCWHAWRSWTAWEQYLADPRIKHLSFGRSSGDDVLRRKMCTTAHQAGKTVHGFGFTKINTSLKHGVEVDSTDSSVDGDCRVWVRYPRDAERGVEVVPIREFYAEHAGALLSGDVETLTSVRVGEKYETRWAPLQKVVRHDVRKPFCEITLETGRRIRVTGDHSLFMMTPTGGMMETKPSSLREGDFITTIAAPKWGGGGFPETIEVVTTPPKKSKYGAMVPVLFDEAFMEFLGLWVADGHFGPLRVGLSVGNDEELVLLVNKIAARFGANVGTAENGVDLTVGSAQLMRVMKSIGFVHGSDKKRLPWFFWQLDEARASAFLRGYFSGDGSGGAAPYVTTVSRELWEQLGEAVPALLERPVMLSWNENEGPSSFNGPRAPSGRVTITGAEAKRRFLERIGFLQAGKMRSVVSTLDVEDRGGYSSMIPTELAFRRPRRAAYRDKGRPAVGRGILRVQRTTDPTAFHPAVLSEDLVYLRVENIEWLPLVKRDVYDLSVPDTEKFVANGVLVHNTSWLMGQKYGITYIFENARWIVLTKDEKAKRAQHRRYYERIGCDYKLIEKDDLAELRKANVIAWRMLADWFHVRKERRDVVLEEWKEHGHLPVLPRSEEYVHPGRVMPLERTTLDLRGSSARERNALEMVIARARALPRDEEVGVVLPETTLVRPRGILREFGVGISEARPRAIPRPLKESDE